MAMFILILFLIDVDIHYGLRIVNTDSLLSKVEAAETSLAKLAGKTKVEEEENDSVFTPPSSSNAELEAALASLHLRDLRCQQLSLEITKVCREIRCCCCCFYHYSYC